MARRRNWPLGRLNCHGVSRPRSALRATGSALGRVEPLEPRHLLAADLIAHWLADDLSGAQGDGQAVASWSDRVGGVEGVAVGSPRLAANSIGGRALVRFDPTDGEDGFRVPAAKNPMTNRADFSIAVALATASNQLRGGTTKWFDNSGLVDGNNLGFTNDWGVAINASGQVAGGIGQGFGSPPVTVYSTASGLNDGQVHLAVFTKSGSTLAIYVDDQPPVMRNDANTAPRAETDLTIGILQAGGGPFTGDISSVRIYSGALTGAEVNQLYQETAAYFSNRAPVAMPDQYTLDEDTPLFFVGAAAGVLANDSDPDRDALTAAVVEPPRNGALTLNSDGSFLYDPDQNFFGTDIFTYTANDFRPSGPAIVTLTVKPVYDPAIPQPDTYRSVAGQVANVDAANGVLANDFNFDQVALAAALDQPPPVGVLTLRPDGSFSYDPQTFSGTTSFSYRVNDGTQLSNPVAVTLIINTPPSAVDDVYTVNEDERLIAAQDVGVLANDSDKEGQPVVLTLVDPPANGTLQLAADGSFSYQPRRDFSGEDTFTYQLGDGIDVSRMATVRITVTSINDPPAAVSDFYVLSASEDFQAAAAQGVLANDVDVDDAQLSAALVQNPLHGQLTFQTDGSFFYRPEAGFNGTDFFTYRASDSRVETEPVAVRLLIGRQEEGGINVRGDSIITFNEVMYNPRQTGEASLEWVELYNQNGIDIDMTGWRITGGITYLIPDGTVLKGGTYLVIAADPQALAQATGYTGALGPFVGDLNDGGEEIELRNNSGRIMDLVDYNDRFPWPIAPDESGTSLAKVYRYAASHEPTHWRSSGVVGGTPGAENFPGGKAPHPDPNVPGPGVAFSEVTASTAAGAFQLELVNQSDSPANLEGLTVYSLGRNRQYVLPAGTLDPGQRTVLDVNQLQFIPVANDSLFLYSADGKQVLDAIRVRDRLLARNDEYGGRWLVPSEPTFGQPNRFAIEQDIVVNEIMYHAPGYYAADVDVLYESSEEWLELFNRSDTRTIDLSGWQFTDGIDFVFPEGTTMGPGQYLVVAKDPKLLLATHPEVRPEQVVGPYTGILSNRGERFELADQNLNPVDIIRYYDEGRWSQIADARGSSLELRDPWADNNIPESWAPSDERASGAWQTIRYRGSGRNNSPDPQQYNEFVLGLLDDGEVLIDDVQVIENPGTPDERQLIQNGTFESDTLGAAPEKWRIIGTHQGRVEADPDNPANQVLHLIATGATEHMHNHAETTLKFGDDFVRINVRAEYEIQIRARWLTGSNQLNSRLYFNRLPRTTRLQMSQSPGTPGRANSQLAPNIGPTYKDLAHEPVVPDANQPVTVGIGAADAQGIADMKLWYSVDAGPFTSVPMQLGPDGRYTATVPGQAASALVHFYVEGTDSAGASSMFPPDGPDSRALYRVQDGQSREGPLHNFRIIMTQSDTNSLHELTNVMSNARIGATVVYRESEVYYDVGVRQKGSERGRGVDVRLGFNVGFDPMNLFRDAHETVSIDRSGAGDEYSQKEVLVKHIINRAGNIPGEYVDLIHLIAPRTRQTGSAILQMTRFRDTFLDSQYENGSDGTVFEYELIYYPTTTTPRGPEGLKLPRPDNVVGAPMRNRGDDKEQYRWYWLIKNNNRQDDYRQLIEMVTALGQSFSPEFVDETNRLLDVDEWLRAFAVQNIAGIGDSYSTGGLAHNAMFYTNPDTGKSYYFPWDMDFSFSSSVSAGLTGNTELNKLLRHPANEHTYYGHVLDIVNTTFNKEYMDPWVTYYDSLVPRQNFRQFARYIEQRASQVISLVERAVPRVPFALNTAGPIDAGDANVVSLEGTGWVDVRQIRVANSPLPLDITWVTENQWQVRVPIDATMSNVTLEAYDFQGKLIDRQSIDVKTTATNVVRQFLRVTEVHYDPPDPRPLLGELNVDNNEFEFIEVTNTGSVPIDLNGVRFLSVDVAGDQQGIAFTFGPGAVQPGASLVVPKNREAFRSRYGENVPLADGFGNQDTMGSYFGRLRNEGERVTLIDAQGTLIQQFAYDPTWYPETNGRGFSLEIVDRTRADLESWNQKESWLPSGPLGGTPGIPASLVGDSNLDGRFDEADLIHVFQVGEYEDRVRGNSTWQDGDWNRDGEFDSGDLVLAFKLGTYVGGVVPPPAQAAASAQPGGFASQGTLAAAVDAAHHRGPRAEPLRQQRTQRVRALLGDETLAARREKLEPALVDRIFVRDDALRPVEDQDFASSDSGDGLTFRSDFYHP